MTTSPPTIRRKRRLWTAGITALAILTIGAPLINHRPTLLLWNASASVPEGLYFVQPNAPLHVGDLAVTKLPSDIQNLAAERQYLPRNVLLIKPVAAASGSEICRRGLAVYIDNRHVGDARAADRRHRPMPNWQGCRVLTSSEIFLMNPVVPDSFDARYFGPIPRGLSKGRALPLLTFPQRPRT